MPQSSAPSEPRRRVLLAGIKLDRGQVLRWLPGLAVLVYAAYRVHVALTDDFVGPHRWDDFKYISRALTGDFDFHVRFRYAHIWGLRGFFGLIEDRRVAAAAYGAVMNAGLVVAAYALGKRASGWLTGVLGAVLTSAFMPLAMFSSTPLCDPPCTLYAALALLCALRFRDPGASLVWPVLCGLAAFASIKSKETGIAVVPAIVWLLAHRPGEPRTWGNLRRSPLVHVVLGLFVGQVVLCVVDGLVSGDALQSLRFSVYGKYVSAVGSLPRAPSATRRVLDRMEWIELLFEPGIREFALAGGLGMIVGFRQSRVVQVLGVWTVFNLLFGAWVCFRYTGIDAHVRYLGPFAPALCVGSAYLLDRMVRARAVPVNVLRDPPRADGAETVPAAAADPVPSWLVAVLALGCLGIGASGLYYGYRLFADAEPSFLVERGGRFLFPLVLPLGLVAAALVRPRPLRVCALMLCLGALVLTGQKEAHEYIARERKEVDRWAVFARHVAAMPEPKVALFHAVRPSILPQLVSWRIAGLSNASIDTVKVRVISDLADARPDETLFVNYHRRKMRKIKKHKIPGKAWKSFVRVPLDRRRAQAYRYVGGS